MSKFYEKTFLEGEIIFKEGEVGEEIYLIEEGEVEIFKEFEGKEKTIAILKEGEVFGEMSVLDGKPRSASARALKDTVLRIMNRESLIEYIKQNPFIEYLINTLIERLRIADEQIKFLSINPEELRFLIFLKWIKSNNYFPFEIKKISIFTGIENKKIEDLIKNYEEKGILKKEKKEIVEIEEEKLEEQKNYLLKIL